ncbi:MAG TPA: LamG domain-containing protein [Kofleriaceae bacterium]|jgi:hypothetical protein
MRSWLVACALLASCGRSNFDGHDADAAADGAGDAVGPSARALLSLDRLDPGVELDDFPLLVTLDDTRAARDLLDATASNIRFFDSSGNLLAHELDQIGAPNGPPLLAWVRMPAIVGLTTTLTVEVGGGLPPPSTQSVWSSDYVAVYHLNDGHDSTKNDHTALPQGAPAFEPYPNCAIGGCQSLNGTADFFSIADMATLALPKPTISGWIYQRSSSTIGMALVSRQAGGLAQDFFLGTTNNAADAQATVTGGLSNEVKGAAVTIGDWYHFTMKLDGTSLWLYVNGSPAGSGADAGSLEHDATPIVLGAASGQSAYLDGMIDEIRLESVPRFDDWVHYEHAAMQDKAIDYGPIVR